jgi:hypothetical protein
MVVLCSYISANDFVWVTARRADCSTRLHEAFKLPAQTALGYHAKPTEPWYSCDVKKSELLLLKMPYRRTWATDGGQAMLRDR